MLHKMIIYFKKHENKLVRTSYMFTFKMYLQKSLMRLNYLV